MRKKFMGLLAGLMAVVITFPVMAAETVTDVSGGDTVDASEIEVFTADIPDENTGEDAVFMSDALEEDDVTTVPGDTEEIYADVSDAGSEEIAADTQAVDDIEVNADISAGNTEETAGADEGFGEADAEQASEEGMDEAEPAEDEIMLLDTPEPEEDEEDDEEDDEVSVTGVSLDKTKVTINTKDQTSQLTATVSPEDATDQSVTWSSSDTKVVTVDKDGKLTAVKDGTATITVTTTDGGYTAKCTVTVSLYSDGFHQDPDGTDWCYYKNGKIATGTTDLIQGTVNGTKGYWNVVKGRVEASATVAWGTVDGTSAWWYINKKGMVDTSYTGFATNSNGSWYAENGKVTKKTNGVYKDTTGALGSSSDWYYILNSKVQTGFTGLADYSNASGWWYVTNGRVDRSVTTIAKNKNGWWYVANGKVDKSYTGFGTNSNGSWYAENGKVTKTVNGVYKDTTGALGSSSDWYYVLNSKVQTGFTGLADYSNASGWWYVTNGRVDRSVTTIAKNKNGWWYVANGKVDKSYTGFGTNSNGSWYAENGKVTKKVNGVYKDTTGALGSSSAWYYVLNSKVQYSFTGLADYSNASGWWYITNGKVDRSYTGLAKNKNGWWYITNGKVDRSYTGTAQNSNGWWYVEKGKVDKSAVALVKVDGVWKAYKSGKLDISYTGMAINENGWWYVDDGTLIRDDCLTDAARYVGSLTSTSQSAEEKLRTVYDYMRSHYNYIRSYNGKPGTGDMASFAVDFFKDQGGNCYRYAIAATCIVKVLGYDTRTVLGNVSTSDGSGMTRHGWCELYINGDWYILDVNFGVYIKKADQHPRKLEVEDTYVLNIENGKAVWE